MGKLKTLFALFISMFKIGLFTFGGGYAMIHLLDNEFVSKKKWLDSDEFMDLVAIAESTPGPIAINCATYIGYKKQSLAGSIFATLGMCLPSFIIIFIISLFFNSFLELSYVSAAFRGMQICVVFLILSAGLKMLRKMKKTPLSITVLSLTLVSTLLFSLFSVSFSSIFYILIFGFVGFFVYALSNIKGEGRGK